MNLRFMGAAREVTGSCYLLSANNHNLLVDCGMEQGQDTYENQPLPVNPDEISCVILTHAHIDHSGMLPALYKKGFRGTIYSTPATMNLCDIMLRDSAHIQETEADWRNRKALRAGEALYEPIYTQEDAAGAVSLFKAVQLENTIEILPGISLKLTDAGHLLGSASITLTLEENGITKKIVFSGDIGNLNQPLLKDPTYLTDADIVVMESTYGDRTHGNRPDYVADLVDALQTTFDRGGNVVIPSFAIGRTQEILYCLREIKQKGMIRQHQGFPVYMDSPLAIKATNIFTLSDSACFDEDMNALLNRGINPISFEDLVICEAAEDSKQINFEKRPCVIISASGMCEAGRIRHHLKHNLWRENCTILFVGYQSHGTLGRALVDGADEVRLFGEDIQVNAEIRLLKAMSGHADRDGLHRWALSFTPKPEKFYLVHGDEDSALSFSALLEKEGLNVYVPYNGDCVDLASGAILDEGPRTQVTKVEIPPAQGTKIKKTKSMLHEADKLLQQAVDRLVKLVSRSYQRSNEIKKQIAKQINKICDKWE